MSVTYTSAADRVLHQVRASRWRLGMRDAMLVAASILSLLAIALACAGTLRALDASERTRLTVAMARIFNEDLPAISLFFNTQPWIFVSALQGPKMVASESNVSWRIHEWDFR